MDVLTSRALYANSVTGCLKIEISSGPVRGSDMFKCCACVCFLIGAWQGLASGLYLLDRFQWGFRWGQTRLKVSIDPKTREYRVFNRV